MASLGVNITIGPPGGRIGVIRLESVTRPSLGERVLQEALARVPPVDNSGDADFSIGGPSSFTVTEPEKSTNPGVHYTWPDDGNQDDEPKEVHIREYDEVSQCWQKEHIVNPDEPEDWVDAKAAIRYVFQSRDTGEFIALNLKPPGAYK